MPPPFSASLAADLHLSVLAVAVDELNDVSLCLLSRLSRGVRTPLFEAAVVLRPVGFHSPFEHLLTIVRYDRDSRLLIQLPNELPPAFFEPLIQSYSILPALLRCALQVLHATDEPTL